MTNRNYDKNYEESSVILLFTLTKQVSCYISILAEILNVILDRKSVLTSAATAMRESSDDSLSACRISRYQLWPQSHIITHSLTLTRSLKPTFAVKHSVHLQILLNTGANTCCHIHTLTHKRESFERQPGPERCEAT